MIIIVVMTRGRDRFSDFIIIERHYVDDLLLYTEIVIVILCNWWFNYYNLSLWCVKSSIYSMQIIILT